MVKGHFKRFGKMITVGGYQFRIILREGNDNRPFPGQGINMCSINNYPHLEDVQQELVFTDHYYTVSAGFFYFLSALMMSINSAPASEAPPTKPPSTSGDPNSSAALAPFTLPP